MTDAVARNHHWVPESYLHGFTGTGELAGKLVCYDTVGRRKFTPAPRNVGAKRDFNRIDVAGQRPDAIERALSPFEDQAKRAIAETTKEGAFPSREKRDWILNLVALIAVRNPRFREMTRSFRERVSKRLMDIVLHSEDRYRSVFEKARQSGHIPTDKPVVGYQEMKEFHTQAGWDLIVSNETHIQQEFELHDTVLQELGRRQWHLLLAPDADFPFITSDHPVVLRSSLDGSITHAGFGIETLEVHFPLTKQLAMVGGHWDTEQVIHATREQIACFNSVICIGAERQVYAPNDTFGILSADTDKIVSANTIFQTP
jgi:hypothetical protein